MKTLYLFFVLPLFILLPFVCCPSRTINDFCNCSARQTATLRQQESCLPMGRPVAQGSKLVCAWLREAQFCCYLDILHGHGILLSMNIVLPTILCTLYAAVLFRLVVERSHERRSRNGRFLRRHITALGYRNRSCAEDHFRQKKTQALSDQRENAQFLPKENSKNTRFVCELMQK